MAAAPVLFHSVIIVERRERAHAAGGSMPARSQYHFIRGWPQATDEFTALCGSESAYFVPRRILPQGCPWRIKLSTVVPIHSGMAADTSRAWMGGIVKSSSCPQKPPAGRQLWRCVSSNPASSCVSDRCCSADRNMSENSISFSSITPPTLMVRTSSVPFGAK